VVPDGKATKTEVQFRVRQTNLPRWGVLETRVGSRGCIDAKDAGRVGGDGRHIQKAIAESSEGRE
jgi:hypothetical protein